MSSTLTLIHLVSEQTMQNLLPLLALKPGRVIQIRSRSPRFEAAARHTEAAARQAGIATEFQDYPLQSEFPDVDAVRRAIKQNIPIFPNAIVNITGGTKLMSLGAYLGASEFPVPILYCDSERLDFIPLGKYGIPAMASFAETAAALTLPVVMAAHGKALDDWSFDVATAEQLEFGRQAFELRHRHAAEFQQCNFSKQIRDFFRNDNGRIPGNQGKLQALCCARVDDCLRDPIPEPVKAFFDAAHRAGFLDIHPNGGFCLATDGAGRKLQKYVERIANILDGSWFELTVLDLVRHSKAFADSYWSVEPRSSQALDFGETDVVAITLPHGSLQVISCKTAINQPLEHLESLRERSQKLGGRYARATFALLHAKPDQIQKLRHWGKLLSVEILIGEEVQRLGNVAQRP